MELMKEFLKILRKTWLIVLIMAILAAFLIKTAPRTLGPVIKEFKEAMK